MNRSVKLILPWPPSLNNYWGDRVIPGKRGRKPFVQKYIKAHGKQFRQDVIEYISERWPNNLKPIQNRVMVAITAIMPDRRKRDLDNLLKATKDSLTHAGFWQDDSLVDFLPVMRGPVEKGDARLEITVADYEVMEKVVFSKDIKGFMEYEIT